MATLALIGASPGTDAFMSCADLGQLYVVLDDDPTGTQEVENAPVLLEWDPTTIGAKLDSDGTLFLLTNTRALDASAARDLVYQAVSDSRQTHPDAQWIMRGDSTLRGHLLPEYEGLVEGAEYEDPPVLVLVPAMPDAGRVTRDGVHYLMRNGSAVPVATTEYALDPVFGYRSSGMLEWAEERSEGYFIAEQGAGLTLSALRRSDGAQRIAQTLSDLADRRRPVVFAPDAETWSDLAIIAAGVRLARVPLAIRAAPSFTAVLTGHSAQSMVSHSRKGSVLVICGSHVPTTTRQLEEVEKQYPDTALVADLEALDSVCPESEVRRLAEGADELIASRRLAVVTTPRALDQARSGLASSFKIAKNLARVLREMKERPDVVVSKGGITSAVVARVGFSASSGRILGPVAPGVALWRMDDGNELAIFPGNIGTDDALAALLSRYVD